jgi:hypothetical protein
MLRTALLVLLTASLHAALTVDLDLARLRAAPGADAVRERLDAMLPAAAQARLQALQALLSFDPRRDLTRVVIDLPDQGPPTIRLVGLPAERIAQALSLRGAAQSLPGGRTGYALPRRPHALFVAVGSHEAVIGRDTALAAGAFGDAPAASGAAISVHLVPGPHPRFEALALARSVDLSADGAGAIAIAVAGRDEAATIELERRLGVIRRMVEVGAEGKLPRAVEAQQLLAATTATRSGARLDVAIAVPQELRERAIERMLDRVQGRIARGGAE